MVLNAGDQQLKATSGAADRNTGSYKCQYILCVGVYLVSDSCSLTEARLSLLQ